MAFDDANAASDHFGMPMGEDEHFAADGSQPATQVVDGLEVLRAGLAQLEERERTAHLEESTAQLERTRASTRADGPQPVIASLAPVKVLPDLRAGLTELAERERTGEANYPLCCAVLYVERQGLGHTLADFVRGARRYLDEMTGDDCVVFVIWGDSDADRDTAAIAIMRYLDVSFEAMPCALFFVPAQDPTYTRVVLRLADFIPRRPAGYHADDIEIACRVIAEEARRVADVPAESRLERFALELPALRNRAFFGDERGPGYSGFEGPYERQDEPSPQWAELSAGASVLSAAAAAVQVVLGGGG